MSDFLKAVSSLEFDKVRDELSSLAKTEDARRFCLNIIPSDSYDYVCRTSAMTSDAVTCLNELGEPPFGNVKNINDILLRAKKGGVLSPAELISLREVFYIAGRLKEYFSPLSERCSVAAELFSRISGNKHLVEKTSEIIISEDRIADTASPALSDIRRKIRNSNNKIKDELARYTSGSYSKYLQDNIVTLRGGRYVIPVKQEYKSEIKGMVHDTSASGSTFFIEPINIVELNNKIKELEAEDVREVERILSGLTDEYMQFSDVLEYNFENITEIAVLFAKASYSVKHRCNPPVFNRNKKIILRRARHPLLDDGTVVPIDISLGEDYDTLVITGPNTGGKTVSLKTLGLLSMLAQSGIHIPAAADCEMCVFSEILADIGDEQSIEQSLSTFSAHMVNAVSILSSCSDTSLVLFDELGAGTDPVEGAALARAILEYVRSFGALCAATTHYAELKAYAFETEGVTNASCEFDVETLRPTYRLVTGTPGRSNAFAICEKIGLPASVIKGAEKYISDDDRRFESVIRKMEDSRDSFEKSSSEAERMREKAKEDYDKAEKILAAAKEEADRITANAERKADSVIRGAEASASYVFKELDKIKKQKNSPDFAAYYSEQKSKLKKAVKRAENRAKSRAEDGRTAPEEDDRPFVKGDSVVISGVGIRGVIASGPDEKGNVTVVSGSFSTKTNIVKLVHSAEEPMVKKEKKGGVTFNKTSRVSVPLEIDLRGENGFDAWQRLDKYIDDVILSGRSTATVIHGKGTGALKKALIEKIKNDKRITAYRQGAHGEGDSGVTILEFGGNNG